jgi:crotonobetainyl-CoA:carnitine CoA-transferase CaiB-like acyl-CoA transferase
LNGGKESVTLDLATTDGRQLFLGLVEHADVVLDSYPAGHLESLGLGAHRILGINPSIVVASITGFGQSGPRSSWLAPDIVGVAMGGLMYISGDPASPPVKPPETQSFYYASVFACYGVLLALLERDASGRGRAIDVSIQESIATQEHMIREAAFDGVPITRNGSQHKHAAPANIFPCRDGYVYLFILTARHWDRFLELWREHPAVLDAPELRPPHQRRAHVATVNPPVEQFTRQYTKADLTALLQSHGIPCLPVNSPSEFLAEEQVRSRDFIGEVSSPSLGRYEVARFPALFDGARPAAAGPAPSCGEHNAAVYGTWLGLQPADLELLAARGVV